ncbi:MAG: hypothetical protein JJU13_07415 [Balneolaceae bacterium]|nr:hypothetical protein [Balneolaceae bacterium]
MTDPIRDARNLALTLRSLKSGMDTYVMVFNALKGEYAPFHESEFYKAFYRGLHES